MRDKQKSNPAIDQAVDLQSCTSVQCRLIRHQLEQKSQEAAVKLTLLALGVINQ